jgi:hypothetical protein
MSFVCLHRAQIFTWFGHLYIHLAYHLLLLVLLVLRVLQLLLRLLVLLVVVVLLLLLLLLLRVASSCSGVFHPYPPPSILPLAPPLSILHPLYTTFFLHLILVACQFEDRFGIFIHTICCLSCLSFCCCPVVIIFVHCLLTAILILYVSHIPLFSSASSLAGRKKEQVGGGRGER